MWLDVGLAKGESETVPSTPRFVLTTVLALGAACASESSDATRDDPVEAGGGRAGSSPTSAGGNGGNAGGASPTGGGAGGAGAGGTGAGGAGAGGTGAGAGSAGRGGAGSSGAAGSGPRDASTGVDAAGDEPTKADQNGPARDASSDASIDASSDGVTPPGPPLVPTAGALLGMFFGADSLAATETTLGRKVAVHLTYYAWEDDWTRGNTSSDLAAGRIPLVNWEPHTPTLDDIVGGTYDTMLHTRAAAAKLLGKPFFLDWGAEMNGNWAPWDGSHNGNSGAKYIAAYQHIHDIFVADGATNVVWAWCPNVEDVPRAAWNETMNYYPGDGYVDWTCVDGYNWGTTNGNGWQTFPQVFSGIYAKLATKTKPILIAEMASTEQGGDKAQWISGIIPALKGTFPQIKGLVWFDINKETDWRIASSTTSKDAFMAMARDAYMNP